MPRKKGLEFFSVDTDIELNDKIALVEAKHGAIGFTVIIKLLIKIYGDNGYYYDWNKKTKLIFSRRINIDYGKVDEIIKDAVEFGFFNKDKFNKYQILTSERIQQHYLDATKRRKRVEVKKTFLVLNNQNDDILRNNVYILGENADILKQKKRKEKKREKKKRYMDFVLLTDEEHEKLTEKLGKKKTEDMIEKLNNYIGSKGKRYKSHYFTILNWNRREFDKEEIKKPRYFKAEDNEGNFTSTPKAKESIKKIIQDLKKIEGKKKVFNG